MGDCFDPRPRVRGDPDTPTEFTKSASFDPRPRVRGDAARTVMMAAYGVSIRAPA